MSQHLKKSHNVSLILYHLVCPIKFRKKIFTPHYEESFKNICWDIAQRYEIAFIEIGTDEDHVHFLIQSVPMFSPTKLVQIIKSITAREMFDRHPELRKILWGAKFWTSGFYINTVGKSANEEIIKNYVKHQGMQYNLFHKAELSEQQGMFMN